MKYKKIFLSLFLVVGVTSNLWAGYNFITFSHQDAASLTNAYDINNDGVVVGYYKSSTGKITGYSFSNGVFTDTVYSGTYETNNHSINNNGQIGGYYYEPGSNSAPFHGYIYDGASGFSIQQYPDAVKEAIHGINDTGEAVGWAWTDSGFLSYYSSNGTFQQLSSGNNDTIYAEAINNQSVIVGGSYYAGKMLGFIENNGDWNYLEYPDADGYTVINSINDSGQLVGMYRTGTDWSSWQYHGFLYDPLDGFNEITVPGDNISDIICHGINEYGDIVGTYVDADGRTCGFIAEVPEPATMFLLSLGSLCFIGTRKRK